jgi:Zn-dependent protease with chaperone function
LIGYTLTFPDGNANWLANWNNSCRSSLHNPAAATLSELQNLLPSFDHRLWAYARIRYALHFSSVFLEIIFIYLFLQLGLAKQLADLLEKRIANTALHTAAFVLTYCAIMSALSFPLVCFSSFGLKHYYGLSDQSFINWLIDILKALVVSTSITATIWCAVYWTLRRFKKAWPYLVFAGSLPLILVVAFAAPLLIDPIFNRIVLMPENLLRQHISKLASQAGIPDAPIFTSDRSKQTKEVNAYVTGIANSARIVVWDTTIKKLPEEQVVCIVAHELGHYVLKHVYQGCAIAAAISLILLPANVLITPRLFKRLPIKWGISSIEDVAGLPLIALLSTMIGFWSEPLVSSYSRFVESEADQYGLTLVRDKAVFIQTFCALSRENLAELAPPPMVKLWLFSHPPLGDRIEAVQQHEFR